MVTCCMENPVIYKLSASDPDGDNLTYSVSGIDAVMTVIMDRLIMAVMVEMTHKQ